MALSLGRPSTPLHSLLEAGGDEVVEAAVEDRLSVANLVVGSQILDARLIEDIRADLMSPPDIGLGVFQLLLLGLALAQFEIVEPRLEHGHRLRAIAVL